MSKHEEQKETKPAKIENKIVEKDVEVKEEYAGNKMNVSIPKFYFGNSINNEGKVSDDTLVRKQRPTRTENNNRMK